MPVAGAAAGPGELRAAQPEPVAAATWRQRRYARADQAGAAAAASDRFLDVVVVLSVVMFVFLVTGLGMLVLQGALNG